MRAFASFSLADSEGLLELAPGEYIGRSDLAGICIPDPRVSEAHAMLSLRGETLHLLALRGRFRVDGKTVSSCELASGLEIELAPGVMLTCKALSLPPALPGLEAEGLPPFLLAGTVSILNGTPLSVIKGYQDDADAVFWRVGRTWKVTLRGAEPREAAIGDVFDIAGTPLKVVPIATRRLSLPETKDTFRLPLTLDVRGEAVRVLREGEEAEVISGIPGRILAALIRGEGTMHWQEITAVVWPFDQSLVSAMRKRFDAGLSRLRERLRPLGDPAEEIVSLDGSGVLVMRLTAEDTIQVQEDE